MTKLYDTAKLREMTQLKAVVHDPDYEIVPIATGGDFLFDPQVFWDWSNSGSKTVWGEKEGSLLISDIGGQAEPGTDWTMGHGAILRLNADNSWETIMGYGDGRQAGVFRPLIAPEGWGEWGGHIFFGSQNIPHRPGAVVEHQLFRFGPGDKRPTGFCIVPKSESIMGGGLSGALLTGVFGRPGTREEGLFLIFSMHNCTIYAVRPDGSIKPWLIMDGKSAPSVMPYRLFYADPELVGEENVLVVEGKWGSNFNDEATHAFEPRHYRVADGTVHPEVIESLAGGAGLRAPAAFGKYAGLSFRPENGGFVSSVHWTEGDVAQPLPYTSSIMRRDAEGKEHVFVSELQAGQNLIAFAGDRMIISNIGHSYSSGSFKDPDGVVFAVQRKKR